MLLFMLMLFVLSAGLIGCSYSIQKLCCPLDDTTLHNGAPLN